MEGSSGKSVVIGCMDEPFRNGNSGCKFQFHQIGDFHKMDFFLVERLLLNKRERAINFALRRPFRVL
jgi:hypothetical protein